MRILKDLFNVASLLAVISLTGCYSDIDLDKYRDGNGENLLVINSIVNPDSTIAVMATRTYFFSDKHYKRENVTDLDINLSVNNESKGLMVYDPESGLYKSEIVPSQEDVVGIATSYKGAEVSGEDFVPKKAVIRSVKVSRNVPTPINWGRQFTFTYEITFVDEPSEENYYFLSYDDNLIEDFSNLSMGERDYTHEYVFQELARYISANIPGWEPYSPGGLPFTDYGIDGKEHTLTVIEKIYDDGLIYGYRKMNRRFRLFSISKDYYQYLVSVLYNNSNSDGLHGGLIDIGLSQPMKYFSNIAGGVGIFAAYSLDTVEVDVMEQTGPFN
jgi:hypothetical protein